MGSRGHREPCWSHAGAVLEPCAHTTCRNAHTGYPGPTPHLPERQPLRDHRQPPDESQRDPVHFALPAPPGEGLSWLILRQSMLWKEGQSQMLAFIVAFKLPLERRGEEERQYKPRWRKCRCSCSNLGSNLSLLLFSCLMIH